MQDQRSTSPGRRSLQSAQPGAEVQQPIDDAAQVPRRGRRAGGRKNGEGSYDVRPDGLTLATDSKKEA